MYLKLDRSKSFLKDIRKINFSDKHYSKYAVFLGKLISKKPLPKEAKDHALKGDFDNFREFHISGDLIVVYYLSDDTLYLTRIGTHSEIFS